MIRRFALPAAAAFLAGLLALLAFLQYRWLGQVSDGERERMRTTLEARAREFAAEFDRELGKASATFALLDEATTPDLAPVLATRWDRWQAAASDARLVRAVLVVDRSTAQLTLRRFDPATRALHGAEWPAEFLPAVARWDAGVGAGVPGATPPAGAASARIFVEDLSDVPALVVPPRPDVLRLSRGAASSMPPPMTVAAAKPSAGRGTTTAPADTVVEIRQRIGAPSPADVFFASPARVVLLWLDVDELRRTLLPALAKKYFAPDDVFDYRVIVGLRRDPKRVWFDSDAHANRAGAGHSDAVGDFSVPMFRAQIAEFLGAQLSHPPQAAGVPPQGGAQQGYAVSVMRFEAARPTPGRAGTVIAVADTSGGWMLRLAHRAGSLDVAVERLRRRNVAVSSTILGLLAVSLGFVLIATRRAQRLAAQKVEFVASVSHELRTPLAVIRSAGENLADGVVEAPDQVKRYGALVASEGRKLGAMVEQVMEFAGMQSDEPRWRKDTLSLRDVVDDAVANARRLPQAAAATIDVQVPEGVPAIVGDRAALARAAQNLIENAIKYGQRAGDVDASTPRWVGICVRGEPGRSEVVSLEVADRGPGIDASERRRIFEPFVRGRAAAASRVPGNGLGLSIVRRIVEAHGGRIEVSRTEGGGATFRVTLRTTN